MTKTVELDFCCPNCDRNQWEEDREAKLYRCVRCRYVVSFDKPTWIDENICNKCSGGGLIQEDGELYTCPKCGGWGSL